MSLSHPIASTRTAIAPAAHLFFTLVLLLSLSACSGGFRGVNGNSDAGTAAVSLSGMAIKSFKAPEKDVPLVVLEEESNSELVESVATLEKNTELNSRSILSGELFGKRYQTPPLPRQAELMAPMIGYFPRSISGIPMRGSPAIEHFDSEFLPADNEFWLLVERSGSPREAAGSQSVTLKVFKGENALLGSVEAEAPGDLASLEAGTYFLRHKQTSPFWYAPDSYFTKRDLDMPASDSDARFRGGALGSHALYAFESFPIHNSPLWNPEVGGIRASGSELGKLYEQLPLGARVVLK